MKNKTRRIRPRGMSKAEGGEAERAEPLVAPPMESEVLERPVGRTIGRYRVCFEIASGGMATVYLASLRGAAGFSKVVALKSIHPHLASDPRFVHMFLDEARIASRLNHANVCQVFDFGEADGTYFLAMEYLAGEPLARVVGRAAAMGDVIRSTAWRSLVARILTDACAGLSAVHEVTDPDGKVLEVVHRDVSPHNVFVTYDGVTKVVDFGIARAKHQVHRTETGEIKGNLPYAAPEQIRGGGVDRRTDVWSLGVVAWEALTGSPLFQRETPVETMYAVLSGGPILRADDVAPWVPKAWADAIDGAVRRDPAERYATVAEMGRAIEAAAREEARWPSQSDVAEQMDRLFPRGRARHAERLRVTSEAAEAIVEAEATPVRGRRRRGAAMLVAGALAVGGAGAAIGIATTRGGGEAPRAPAVVSSERVTVEPDAGVEVEPVTEETVEAVALEAAPPDAGRRAVKRVRARERGTGQVNVVTPDGWAIVYRGGERLGQTPLRVTLPAGVHTLEVRPFGRAPGRRVRVRVPANGTARTTVRVAD